MIVFVCVVGLLFGLEMCVGDLCVMCFVVF